MENMDYIRRLLLWMCCWLSILQGMESRTYKNRSDEEKLLEYLFEDYNPSARPVLNSSNTVNVKLRFSLLQIQELNVRSQVLTTTGLLILHWTDERLTWDNEINPLDEIVIDGKKIWKPEFAVINGADGIYGDYGNFQANLYPNGSIRWEPGGVFKTMCQIDITYYPFDDQSCALTFGAWSYYTTKMNLTTDKTDISLESYETNGEWRITRTSLNRSEFSFDCCPDQKFSNIAFRIHLQRRSTFYIMNVILPGILTSAVLLSIFFCTPSQKVHIGVAALLSFRLFLLNVADTIPRTSDHVPLLGIYLTCTMAITTMAMVATVFVLNLYGMKEKPVPLWAKKVFVVYLSRVLCMCNCASPQDRSDMESANGKPPRAYVPVSTRDGVRPQWDPTGGVSDGDGTDTGDAPPHAFPYSVLPHHRQSNLGAPAKPQPEPHVVYSGDGDARTRKPNYNKDWVHVAAVCDRFFFWLCLMFITVTTLLLFHPLTTSRYFRIPILEREKGESG